MNITQLTEHIKSTHDSKPFSDENMKKLVDGTSFKLPPSYLYFISHFGNGDTQDLQSYQIFDQDIDSPEEVGGFSIGNPDAPEFIPLQGGEPVPKSSLFCLMTEDSNGGVWCWLTSEPDENGELALAYYEPFKMKLFYRVPNFTTWLEILVREKQEVIRSLDVDEILGLG